MEFCGRHRREIGDGGQTRPARRGTIIMTSIQQDDQPIGMGRLTPPPVGRGDTLRRHLRNHRAFISSLAFFILMIAAFAAISPSIWSKPTVYSAVAISLPTLSIIAVALVFVVAAGEIDLSFGAGVTFSGLVFSYTALAGLNPVLAALLGNAGGHWNWTDQRRAYRLYWPFRPSSPPSE